MRDLIVYYSLEGNTQYVAEKLAEQLGAEVLRLVPKKAYSDKGFAKFFWGGKSAVMGEKPELEAYSADLAQFDRVIFGTPVWAATFTPPLRTFITEQADKLAGKKFAAFACQGGSGAEKTFKKLAKLIGIDAFTKTAVFNEPKAKWTVAKDTQIEEFGRELLAGRYD